MKLWTAKLQNQWNENYKYCVPGMKVTPNDSYTGDKDRIGVVATIVEVASRELQSGHVALEKLGFTHEELYVVQYSDGYESVLWPDECKIVEGN